MTIPGKRSCHPQPAERGAKKPRQDLNNSEATVRGNFIDLTLNDEDNDQNAHVAGALEVTSSSTVNGSLIDQTSRPSLSYSPHIVDKLYDTCFGMVIRSRYYNISYER